MSDIRLIIDFCTCCDRPTDQCGSFNEMVQRGVPPSEISYEVVYPEVRQDAD